MEQTNGRKVNLRGEETVDNFKKIGKKIVDFLGVFIPNITFLVIFLTFMVTIVSRYFFKTPVTWSYDLFWVTCGPCSSALVRQWRLMNT